MGFPVTHVLTTVSLTAPAVVASRCDTPCTTRIHTRFIAANRLVWTHRGGRTAEIAATGSIQLPGIRARVNECLDNLTVRELLTFLKLLPSHET